MYTNNDRTLGNIASLSSSSASRSPSKRAVVAYELHGKYARNLRKETDRRQELDDFTVILSSHTSTMERYAAVWLYNHIQASRVEARERRRR
jgi:hypothetical protein